MYILSPDDLPYFNAKSYDLKKSDTQKEVLVHVRLSALLFKIIDWFFSLDG